jgi:predicted Fe-Mo cluster-binding NifX family protein
MRICFSIQEAPSEDMKLTEHFGESERFLIFDTQLNTFKPHTCDPTLCRGTCHCHLPTLPEGAFDAVICRNIGGRAFAMLRRSKIAVFLTQESHVSKALDGWKTQNLHVAKHGVCRPEIVALRHEQRRRKER